VGDIGNIGVLQSPYGRGRYIVARDSLEAATAICRTRGLAQLNQVARGGRRVSLIGVGG